MKTTVKADYAGPSVEVIEILAERVLADSGYVGGGDINDFWPGYDDDFDLDY